MRKPQILPIIYLLVVLFTIGQGHGKQPDNLFPVSVSGKWGYINSAGKIVITPQFDNADVFSEGLASVNIGEDWFYIDPQGQQTIKGTFSGSKWAVGGGEFSEGLAAAPFGYCAYGYINRAAQTIITGQFYSAGRFSEGLAHVRPRDGRSKDGYINNQGKFTVNPQFDKAEDFSEGLAAVALSKKWGYIDPSGHYAIASQFEYAYSFSEGLAAVLHNNKWGYIDKTGRFVIEARFEGAADFGDGLAPVMIGGKWGYIDKSANIIIKPQYGAAQSFSGGIAEVSPDHNVDELNIDVLGNPECISLWRRGHKYKWGYINKTGKYVWLPSK
jgi:WG containing repeat